MEATEPLYTVIPPCPECGHDRCWELRKSAARRCQRCGEPLGFNRAYAYRPIEPEHVLCQYDPRGDRR